MALGRGWAASACRLGAKRELDSGGASEGGGRGLAAGTHRSQISFSFSLSFSKLKTFKVFHRFLVVPPLSLKGCS